jgi:hypothetical protein
VSGSLEVGPEPNHAVDHLQDGISGDPNQARGGRNGRSRGINQHRQVSLVTNRPPLQLDQDDRRVRWGDQVRIKATARQ